jgi:hypothetical protein
MRNNNATTVLSADFQNTLAFDYVSVDLYLKYTDEKRKNSGNKNVENRSRWFLFFSLFYGNQLTL